MLAVLFPLSLFLSAILLFSVQPMVAKALLPVYGGTPAVWTVCMLFFQLVLLISYGYVWLLSFIKRPVIWRGIYTLLIAISLVAIPLLFRPTPMENTPEWGILSTLLTQIGLPLLVIGASAPLLQFAYSQTKGRGASDPYFLYIASNLGSLLALLSYPWLIEHYTGLIAQFHWWSIGYLGYVAILLVVIWLFRYQPLPLVTQTAEKWPWRAMIKWVGLSFIPCSLMLSVTLYLTTDVAATPLFWVVPLALYLLSFIVTFSLKPLISQDWVVRNYLFFLIFTILGFILGISQVIAWQLILFNLLNFFILAVLCHGQLFLSRPKPQQLTLFYFCLAFGGVIAGVFNGIIAPHCFNQIYEYPLGILLSLLVVPNTSIKGHWYVPFVVLALALVYYLVPDIKGHSTYTVLAIAALIGIVCFKQSRLSMFVSVLLLFGLLFIPIFSQEKILLQERNFYGVKKVQDVSGAHLLISQSTLHGFQLKNDIKSDGFKAYYAGTRVVVQELQAQFNSMAITLIGLGTGTIVCQFRAADSMKVIEIDEQMINIAKNPALFSYLRDCSPKVQIIKNDGRLALAQIADNSQQLLIMDAFNSDAVPVHLLTLEAFSLYKKKMTADGAILVNLSNRHLNLLPVLIAAGQRVGLEVFYLYDKGDYSLGKMPSQWGLFTANTRLIAKLSNTGWQPTKPAQAFLWTDDYSNIVPLMKLF